MAQFSHSATNWHSLSQNHRFPNGDGVNVSTPIEGIAHFPEWEQFVKKKKKKEKARNKDIEIDFTVWSRYLPLVSVVVCVSFWASPPSLCRHMCASVCMCVRAHVWVWVCVCGVEVGAAKCVCMRSIQTVNTLMPLKRREEVQQTAPLVKVSWLTFAAACCGATTGLWRLQQQQQMMIVHSDSLYSPPQSQIRVTEQAMLFYSKIGKILRLL